MKHIKVPAITGIALGSLFITPFAVADPPINDIESHVRAMESSIPTFDGVTNVERVSAVTVKAVTVEDGKDAPKFEIERASFVAEPKPEPKPEPVELEVEDSASENSPSTSTIETPALVQETAKVSSSVAAGSSDAYTSDTRSGVKASYKDAGIKLDFDAENKGMETVVKAAYQGIGSPYVWGGNTPSGWDCSGFTKWAYAKAGINIQRTTSSILASGQFERTSTPQPGDLVFQNGGKHVGIYVGKGKMIGAQNPSIGTILHDVNRNPVLGYYTLKK